MSGKTAFAGLEWLAPGDSLSSDGYAFQSLNPLITDFLLKVGALTHRHDAHSPMANPAQDATVAASGTGGTIPNATSIYVAYTLTDTQGGETLPSNVSQVLTPSGYADPTGAPTATLSFAAGTMLASAPMYAVTVTDGLGGETALGPPVSVSVPASQNAEVVLSDLTAITNDASANAGAAGWRLWRSMDGGNTWDLMATGAAGTDTWTDDGTTIGDCSVSPPVVGSTGDTGSFTVTVPAGQPTEAQFINLYASDDGTFTSPALLGTYPISDAGTPMTFTALTTQQGSPPAVGTTIGGAAQIDPDTDILDWTWKRAVPTIADLPTTGNDDGDVRVALDGPTINVWHSASQTWVQPGGGGGGGVTVTDDNNNTVVNPTELLFSGTGIAVDQPATGEARVTINPLSVSPMSIYGPTSGDYQIGDDGGDALAQVRSGDATPVTYTVPVSTVNNFAGIGTWVEVLQYGAGQVTIVPAAGVTLNAPGGFVRTKQQFSTIRLLKIDTDEWVLSGDLA